MTTTYNSAQLATSALFEVRFLMGDTGPDRWIFTDEEINFVLGRMSSPCATAVFLADRKAAELASIEGGSWSIGDLSVTNQMSSDVWRRFSDALRNYCAQMSGGLTAINIGPGGLGYEWTRHIFAVGQHDSPETGAAFEPIMDGRPLPPDWYR